VGAFGEKLRHQREQRGLALEAISNTTKISTRMLRALEDEHFDQLPGGVFNKGFVRAYARQVGLDEEETVTEYLAALRESQVQSQPILPDFRSTAGKSRSSTPLDSRHHILPASDHPAGMAKGNGKDLTTEDRRKQERRNEVRRSQDRDQKQPALNKTEQPSHAGNLDAPLAAGVAQHTEDIQKQNISQHHIPIASRSHEHSEIEDHRHHAAHDDNRQMDRSPSMSGFITLAPGAEILEETNKSANGHSAGISRIKLATAALLIIAALAVWISRRRHEPSIPQASASSAASSPVPPTLAPAVTSAATSPSPISPKVTVASSPAKPSPEKSSPKTQLASGKPSSETPTSTAASTPSPNLSPAGPAVTNVPAASTAIKPAPTFTLLIRADQTTWISIIADGKPETHETLIAPAHTSIRAAHDVTIKVGNAAGVSFQLNGKEFPAEGNAGEVKTYFFDATGMKPAPQTAVQVPIR